jgi:hypothetical protein
MLLHVCPSLRVRRSTRGLERYSRRAATLTNDYTTAKKFRPMKDDLMLTSAKCSGISSLLLFPRPVCPSMATDLLVISITCAGYMRSKLQLHSLSSCTHNPSCTPPTPPWQPLRTTWFDARLPRTAGHRYLTSGTRQVLAAWEERHRGSGRVMPCLWPTN